MALCLLLCAAGAEAASPRADQDTTRVNSVVIKKKNSKDSLARPVVKPRKWRPRVVIVPANSPGGRSRQEIEYSDSLGRRR